MEDMNNNERVSHWEKADLERPIVPVSECSESPQTGKARATSRRRRTSRREGRSAVRPAKR